MKRLITLFIITLVSTSSCKSSKTSHPVIANLSSKKVIKKNFENRFDKSNLKANLTFKYKGSGELPNLNASLRIKKDSVIWLSLTKFGIPLAKIIIDQNNIKFYEKLSKTYFVGNFDLISHWLGVELDFIQIQNLFLGEPLINLKEEKYEIQIQENLYALNPKNNPFPFEIFFMINPINFKLEKEALKNSKKEQQLVVKYKGYDEIDKILFPKGFIIHALDKKSKTIVDINYRNVTFDTPLNFPFKIPNGYKEFSFNDHK